MHDYRVLLKVMTLGLKKYKKYVLHNEFCLCMIVIGCW